MGVSFSALDIAKYGAIPVAAITAAHWIEKESSDQRFVLAAKVSQYVPVALCIISGVNDRLSLLILNYGMLSWAERTLPVYQIANFNKRYSLASDLAGLLTIPCMAMFVTFPLIMHRLQKLAHKNHYTKLGIGLGYAEKIVTTAMKIANFGMTFIGFMSACQAFSVPFIGFYLLCLATYIPPALAKRVCQTAHVAIFGL
jgi:hypothetical protein